MIVDESLSGKIITFYSYKGGTGRSMALANAACWLTQRKRSVLMMDWDLEAPGLHRYFETRSKDPADFQRAGLIEYFIALRDRLSSEPKLYERLCEEDSSQLMREEFPLDEYLIRNVVPSSDLIKSGRLDANYAEQVSSFDWVDFYLKYGRILEPFREMLAAAYDYTLIDSRTGFNDVSGVCTMLLPEKLVTVFTPNKQSLSGVIDLSVRATDYRRASNDFRPLSVFPLASRIENAELELKREWRKRYQQKFEIALRKIYQLEVCNLTKYFDDVILPQVAYYAYGEKVALLEEERSDALSLGRAYEIFFKRLIECDFAWDAAAETEAAAGEAPLATAGKTASRDTDVYVSYAHYDNQALVEGTTGWVDMLRERLSIRLAQMLGREVRIWQDPRTQANDYYSEELIQSLPVTALFICVLTPRYVQSEWCLKELREINQLAATSSSRGGKSSIFKVVKTYVEPEQQPEELRGLLGYKFFELDNRGRALEYDAGLGVAKDSRYWEKLEDLAWDIMNTIRSRDSPTLPVIQAPSAQAAVYLAETTSDLTEERTAIRRELLLRGLQVLPDKALALGGPELIEEVQACLKRCALSVHLIGEPYGMVPEGQERSIVELQAELAGMQVADVEFKRIAWMLPGHIAQEERQQSFVNRLLNGEGPLANFEVLQTPLTEVKDYILAGINTRQRSAKALSSERVLLIYLIFDKRDAEAVAPLADYLFACGYEVLLPILDGDEAEVREDHKEKLVLCDAFMIFYGQASEMWLRMKLSDLQKATGYDRTNPVLAKIVYVASPETTSKTMFRTHEAEVIQNFGVFDPAKLEDFLSRLSAAKEGWTAQTKLPRE